MTDEEVAGLVIRLEQQEVDCQTGSGAVPGAVYCELLAAYLASSPPELTRAKFLVQRLPGAVRETEEGAELARLWTIGKNMLTGNTADVHSGLAGPWSESVQRIMDKLSDSLKMVNLKLVGDAYSSIKISQLAGMLGMSEEEAAGMSEQRGWGLDRQAGVVRPARCREAGEQRDTKDQLDQIIHFVSYLEN